MALQERFGVSERRTCQVVGQPRSTQRLDPPVPSDDELALRAWLRDFSRVRPRWRLAAGGCRGQEGRVAGQPQADPPPVARGRAEGALQEAREAAVGHRGACRRHEPHRANVVWGALDFQFDQTRDGRLLKLLNVIDEFTREGLAIDVGRSIDATGVVTCLERLAHERRAPARVRFDHGTEFIAYAVTHWCQFNGTGTVFIDPGSPWQNTWDMDRNRSTATSVPPWQRGPRRSKAELRRRPGVPGAL